MKTAGTISVPTVDEILTDTKENLDTISHNIAKIVSAIPSELSEGEENTNLLLLVKRYINDLKNTRLLLDEETLSQIHKLVAITDNVTTSTFIRLTQLLNVHWSIVMVNPNHDMLLFADGKTIVDVRRDMRFECTISNMFLKLLRHVIDYYGEVDLRQNVKYIQPYTVNNILSAIRNDHNISSYLFEKFNKLWNISYRYTITSNIDPSVEKEIVLDPSGWM